MSADETKPADPVTEGARRDEYAVREEKRFRCDMARMSFGVLLHRNGVVQDSGKVIAQSNAFVDALIASGLWPER
jgi:hypothetical protein